MQDISQQLSKVMLDKECSAFLAFIVVEDGLHIQEPESKEQSCRRLCDKRNFHTDEQVMGIRVH